MHITSRTILALLIATLAGCDAPSDDEGGEGGGAVDGRITVGEPEFIVESPEGYGDVYRVAWTGEVLLALTDPQNSSQTPQLLMHVDPATGAVLTGYQPQHWMRNMDYANGLVWDVSNASFDSDRRVARTYRITGEHVADWAYGGPYEMYYYLAYGGGSYRAMTNYDCDGYNCQALVEYSEDGEVLSVDEDADFDDLTFGGGHFWAFQRWNGEFEGLILKLDLDFNVVQTYRVTDYERFGEVQYANEIAMHLVYIDSNLWVVDRDGGFYKTPLQ